MKKKKLERRDNNKRILNVIWALHIHMSTFCTLCIRHVFQFSFKKTKEKKIKKEI